MLETLLKAGPHHEKKMRCFHYWLYISWGMILKVVCWNLKCYFLLAFGQNRHWSKSFTVLKLCNSYGLNTKSYLFIPCLNLIPLYTLNYFKIWPNKKLFAATGQWYIPVIPILRKKAESMGVQGHLGLHSPGDLSYEFSLS